MLVLLVAGVAAVAVFALSQGKGGSSRTMAEWLQIEADNMQDLGVGADPRKYAWEASVRHLLTLSPPLTGYSPVLISVVESAGNQFVVTYRAISLEGITAQNVATIPMEAVGDIVVSVSQVGYSYQVTHISWPSVMGRRWSEEQGGRVLY